MTPVEEARFLVADALEKTADDIAADGVLGVVPGWDSLGHMRIVLSLESKLSRALTANEILEIKSVTDISALLANGNGKLG